MMTKTLRAVFIFLLFSTSVLAQSTKDRYIPERVILNLTEKPSSSVAVTWRTVTESAKQGVEFAEATDGVQFEKIKKMTPAKREHLEADKSRTVFHYSVVLGDLKPGVKYVYRVGGDSVWSEWNQFTTARASAAPFKFVWFGDPQDDINEHVSRVFREAYKTAPGANFWLFSGDLTSEPVDTQIGELFSAAGFIWRMVPSVMTPGNHDLGFRMEQGVIARNARGQKERTKSVSALWRSHFTLPENGIVSLEETSYSFDFQGVRIIMVNSNDKLQEQAAWMEKLLSENPNTWTIVSFHHPLYSCGRERDGRETRNAFLSIFDRYNVDLVLTGHDHAYTRSKKLKNGVVVGENEKGTVYMVSSSGPEFYVANPLYQSLMAKTAVDKSLFQVVSVDGNRLSLKAYSAAGLLFDSFELVK